MDVKGTKKVYLFQADFSIVNARNEKECPIVHIRGPRFSVRLKRISLSFTIGSLIAGCNCSIVVIYLAFIVYCSLLWLMVIVMGLRPFRARDVCFKLCFMLSDVVPRIKMPVSAF